MDLHRHLDEIDEHGFSVVPGVIAEPEIAGLRSAVADALDQDWERFGGLPGKDRSIALELAHYGGPLLALLDNEVIDALFGALLGDRWILYSYTSTAMLPELHQATAEIHTDTARITPGLVLGALATIALDPFTEENGATFYLPGSHRTHPHRPDENEFREHAVRVCRDAGDAVVFHPRVWHAGGRNTTTDTRFAVTLYGTRSYMRQRFDYPRLMDADMVDAVPDRVRRILGMNVRVPTSLEEFYVPADERLYKSGQG
ncbi:MAG: phytanoyl-CoA dioxygenase family protein [Actinomycetota bacterium]